VAQALISPVPINRPARTVTVLRIAVGLQSYGRTALILISSWL